MAQFLRPDGNITQTSFTNGFAAIDESTASDADFAYGADNTAAELEVSLSNPSGTPGAGSVIFRYRIARTNDGVVDGAGNSCTVTARLMQGTTQIATDTARTASGTWTEYSYTLTSPERSAITDWNDLRLEFVTSASGGSPANRRGAAVSWAELEAPDFDPTGNATANLVTVTVVSLGATASVPAGAYLDEVAADNPVAWWRFGEPSGTTAADEIGTADGTYTGTVTLGATGAIADDDGALQLNGTDAYVSVPDSAAIDLGDGPLSVEMWVKRRSALQQNNALFAKGSSAPILIMDDAVLGQVEFYARGVSLAVHSSTNITDTTTWHHIVGTKSATDEWKLYIDGVDVSVSDGSPSTTSNANALFIGADNVSGSPGSFSNVLMDEVAIYNTVLSPQRVLAHYEAAPNQQSSGDPGNATAGLVTVAVSPLAATANGAGTATANLVTVSLSPLPSTGHGAATTTAGLVSVSATAQAATATGAGTASAGLVSLSLTPLAAEAIGSANAALVTLGVTPLAATAMAAASPAAGLPATTLSPLPASASGAAAAAAGLPTVTASALAPSATGAVTVGASLASTGVSALASSATGAGTATASLVVVSVSALSAQASGGESIPGTADANLVSATLTPITAASSGAGLAQASTPSLALSPLSVDSTGAAVATASLVTASLSALAATAQGSGVGTAPANLVGLTLTPLAATATGAASISGNLASVSVSALAADATGGSSIPGTANGSLVGLTVVALSATANGAASTAQDLSSVDAEPLTATAIGAAIASAALGSVGADTLGVSAEGEGTTGVALVGLSITPLSATADGCGTAAVGTPAVGLVVLPAGASAPGSAIAGLAVITLSPLAIDSAGTLSGLAGTASQMASLLGANRTSPTLLGVVVPMRTLSGQTASRS